jgi:hypothetical protein
MFRVFGCPANATLNLNGTGPAQQGDCTLYQTGDIVPAVPIETWVAARLSGAMPGLQTQNAKLQKEVEELTARMQALETAAQQRTSAAPGSKPGTLATSAYAFSCGMSRTALSRSIACRSLAPKP